jgi:hypothetical protein
LILSHAKWLHKHYLKIYQSKSESSFGLAKIHCKMDKLLYFLHILEIPKTKDT